MPAPVILIPGTHSLNNIDRTWWMAGSEFVRYLQSLGVDVAGSDDPYYWTTEVDGVFGPNCAWDHWGDVLRWYAHAKYPPLNGVYQPVSIIAHSHGGQVALCAAASGLVIDTLVTIATPVRQDMIETIRHRGRSNIRHWHHLYSDDSDWWQWFGSWFDGSWRLRRKMPNADTNTQVPGVGHGGLLSVDLWIKNKFFTQFGLVPQPPTPEAP